MLWQILHCWWLEERLGVFLRVIRDCLIQTEDCHQDLTLLIGLRESLLSLLLIANHQLLFLLLSSLKSIFCLGDSVTGIEDSISHALLELLDICDQ